MNPSIRSISVHVGEPHEGAFYWVLMEKAADSTAFNELAAARKPTSTWAAALDAGVVELKRLAGDLARGPRASTEDEDADPVG